MIFGILPHEYNSNRYNINNLIETYTIIDEGEMKWAMDLNEIYFYSNKNKKMKKFLLTVELLREFLNLIYN